MTLPHTSLRVLTVAVTAVALGIQTAPVRAQGDSAELEEVIVTARKREESLQETPIAVSAFSGESLVRQGIGNVSDFNEAVPGMEVQAGNGVAGVANIYIRGVGQRNTEPNLDSGVGIYLDGVYISRADGALLDMNDVRSVQVLRGPQGTLFGKNTTGGAMLIETNRPAEELEGKLSVTVGNYDQLNGAAVLNLPLVDGTLYTRLSLMSVTRDGYIDNLTLDEEYSDEDRQSAIWQTRWTPTENLTADLNLNYATTDQTPRGTQCVPSSTNFGQGWQSELQNGAVRLAFDGKSLEEFCLDSAATDKDETLTNLGGGYYSDNTGASLTLDWDIGGEMTLKSITAWRETVAGQNDDLEPLAISFLHRTNDAHPFAQDRETEQWSQEFNLAGEAWDGRVSWIAGAHYFAEETDRSRTVALTGPWELIDLGALDVMFYNASGTDLITDNEAWAGFAQSDWTLTDRWTLTTGVRYTTETRELTRNRYLPVAASLSDGGLVIPTSSTGVYLISDDTFNPVHDWYVAIAETADVDADAWTPMASLRYSLEGGGFVDEGSVYLTVSKGFRSGGLSEAPSDDLEEFEPEEVINYEFGLKLDALDRRMRMNAALFTLDYTDRQLTTIAVSAQGRIAGATVNAAESSVTGMELEGTFLATDKLELTLNAAWYDDEIDEYIDTQLQLNRSGIVPGGSSAAPNDVIPTTPTTPNCSLAANPAKSENVGAIESCEIDRSDENLPRLPEKSIMLAAQYTFETSFGAIVPRLQYSKKYGIDSCFDRISCTSGDWLNDHEDLSARLSWMSSDAAWSVTAYGQNLTDEDFVIGGQPLYDAIGFGGYVYAPPRMYGAEFSYRW